MQNELPRPNMRSTLERYAIEIHTKGTYEFISCPDPNHPDRNPSCQVNFGGAKETFKCYSCGAKGDVFQLISYLSGKSNEDVLRDHRNNLPFTNFRETKDPVKIFKPEQKNTPDPTNKNKPIQNEEQWLWEMAERYTYGLKISEKIDPDSKLHSLYPVHLADKNLFGAMLRFEPKAFKQVTIIDNEKKAGQKKLVGTLRLKGEKMLPFGWQNAEKPDSLIVVEGQKAAQSLQNALGDSYGVISLNGVNSDKKIDWSLVEGKTVYLWGDHDDAGQKCMKRLQKTLNPFQPKGLTLVSPQWEGIKEKDDAHDYVLHCAVVGKPVEFEELLKSSRTDKRPIFVDFDEKGKPEETIENFDVMCNFFNVKPMIDVFSKESGLVDLKTRSMLYDADVLTFCSKSRFPKQNRMSFIEAPLKKSPSYLNRFKDQLDSLPDADGSRRLLTKVFNAFKFKENVLSHFIEQEGEINGKVLRDGYLQQIFDTWLKLVYFQGCVLDKKKEVPRTVLLLKGFQSIGKTRWFDTIVPEGFFHEGAGLPQDGDEKNQVTTSLVTELSEFDSMTANEQNRAKGFISNKRDTFRKKYGREALTYPRVTTFVATTNRNKFFRDSENTRFWTLNVEDIDKALINSALPNEEAKWQFWKEVERMFFEDGGLESLFTKVNTINRIFEIENEKYRFTDYTEDVIEDSFDNDKMKAGVFDYYLKKKDLYKLICYGENMNASKEMTYAIIHYYERIKSAGSIMVKVRPLDSNESKKPVYAYPVSLKQEDTERFNFIKKHLLTK